MSTQDCPNCHYTPPKPVKKDEEECPQCFYPPKVETKEPEECPQCHYQPDKK